MVRRVCVHFVKYSAHMVSMPSQIYTPFPHMEALPPFTRGAACSERLRSGSHASPEPRQPVVDRSPFHRAA